MLTVGTRCAKYQQTEKDWRDEEGQRGKSINIEGSTPFTYTHSKKKKKKEEILNTNDETNSCDDDDVTVLIFRGVSGLDMSQADACISKWFL